MLDHILLYRRIHIELYQVLKHCHYIDGVRVKFEPVDTRVRSLDREILLKKLLFHSNTAYAQNLRLGLSS
jgi:hypothetical protein